MTTEQRIDAILNEGTIIPVVDLPTILYVKGPVTDQNRTGIAGTAGAAIFFDIDSLKDMADDKLAFVVRHELMHVKYARLADKTPREVIAFVDAGWLATLKGALDEGVIVRDSTSPTDDWTTLLQHVIDTAVVPAQPPRED